MSADTKILGAGGCRCHPSPQLMASYAAGRLACAEAIAVATHIALCPDCAAVHRDVMGGIAETQLDAATPAGEVPAFSRCLVQAKMQQKCEERLTARLDLPAAVLPILRKYAGCAHWWPVWRGIKRLRLNIRSPQTGYSASLIRIKAGTRVPLHRHDDTEYMVIIQGTLVDENGTHKTGAFITMHAGESHAPMATADGDVTALNIARGTVCFMSKWLCWLNPFMRRECSAKTA